MLFGGIDWSDQTLDYHLRKADGSELTHGRVQLSCQGLTELFVALDRHGQPDQIALAIETTHGAWIQALLDRGYSVYPINPKRADAFRESLSANGDKSDTIDARALAMLLATLHQDLRALKADDPQMVALRIGCQDRLRLVNEHTAKSNELLAILKTHYPAFLGLFGDHTSQIALEFLQQFPTQHQMKSLSPKRLSKWLAAHAYSRAGRIEEMLQVLQRPALPVPMHLQTSKAPLIQYLCTSLVALQAMIAQQEQKINQDFEALPQSRWAKSLPGAGPTLQSSLLAIFGRDPQRFASAAEARALMGTAPVTKSSGKVRSVHFRRGCWKFARRTLHLFADHSRRRCAWTQAFYQQQIQAGKQHHRALRALAHKWVKIIWALVRTDQVYQEAVYLASQARYQAGTPAQRKKHQ